MFAAVSKKIRNPFRIFTPLIVVAFLIQPLIVTAQSGSADGSTDPSASVPPEPSSTLQAPKEETGAAAIPDISSTTVSEPTPRETPLQVSTPTVPISGSTGISTSSTPTPTTTENSVLDVVPEANTPVSPLIWIALVALALVPFGYVLAKSLNKNKVKETEEDIGCFNIKKLLEKKFRELTDLKSQLKNKAIDTAQGAIREGIRGTTAGDTLILIEKAEKEYNRLKKLYEECMVEFEKRAFRAVIVESSLRDKKILEKFRVEKTYTLDTWTLHNVFVAKEQIPELQKHLAEGPWYIHLWKKGNDEVTVVFKNEIFSVKSSDKSTWISAIAYGKSIGIPEEQLDFKIG